MMLCYHSKSLAVVCLTLLLLAVGQVKTDDDGDGFDCDDEIPTPPPPEPDCPNQVRVDEIAIEIGMIRLAMKGLLEECPAMEDELEIDCECTESIEPYDVAVTSEGGLFSVSPAESLAQNETGLFRVDGRIVNGAGNWRRGLNFVVVQRATKEITSTREFDIWEDESLADNCATFINDEIPEDSIVLVSVSQVVTSRIEQLPGLWEALAKLGAIKRFKFFDSFAMVGFKPSPGLCDLVPDFITEKWAPNVTPDGNQGRWTAPVTASAAIPINCQPYTQGIDFEVKLVSEADPGSRGVEYELDAPNKALFFINGKRIVASPWDQGYNIVVLDPVSRLPISQKASNTADGGDQVLMDYIDSIPEGSVVLVSVWGRISGSIPAPLSERLVDIGADFSSGRRGTLNTGDTFALIGYKGRCPDTHLPSWKTQGMVNNPRRQRGDLNSEPLEVSAVIRLPLCDV